MSSPREPTGDELMQDKEFAATVHKEWEDTKRGILQKVKQVSFSAKTIPDSYVEAMKIYNKYLDFKDASQWDNAFYCLHLYLACALTKLLHRPRATKPTFEKQANEVFDTLQKLQDEMNRCMWGIKLQIIEKERRAYVKKGLHLRKANVGASGGSTSGSKRFSASQITSALDALRLDGKKTTNVRLYGDLDSKLGGSNSASVAPPSAPPPPSYDQVTGGRGYHNTRGRSMGYSNTNKYRVKKVLGDGNCAFRSIAQSQYGGELNSNEEYSKAMELRHSVAQELRRCASEEMSETGLTVEQLVLMKDSHFPTFNEYVNAMAKSTYAGETEFWLLARKLGINIAIFQPSPTSGGYDHIITYGDSQSPPIMLLWQRGKSEAGNHYDCLLPS